MVEGYSWGTWAYCAAVLASTVSSPISRASMAGYWVVETGIRIRFRDGVRRQQIRGCWLHENAAAALIDC